MQSLQQRVRSLSEAERQEYEARAEQFEEAIESGSEMGSFLPAEGRLRVLLIAQFAKREMEHHLQRGIPRKVEDYLSRFPELAHDSATLLELLLWEYRLRHPSGGSQDEFIRRFPDLDQPFRAAAAEMVPPQPFVPPADYELDNAPIGKGAWGVVYKSFHKPLQRHEALKVVDPLLPRNRCGRQIKAQIERLRNEIPVAARLNHPNIVHLYNGGESNGHPYFAMEYCSEGSLQDKLDRGPLAPAEAANLLRTLALAVDAIHAFGLIHRDLKPSNVLFGEGGVAKIADFGLTLTIPEGQTAPEIREIAGTPAYMAPEQADPSAGSIGPATDVYGLGAVLYACLAGRPPVAAITQPVDSKAISWSPRRRLREVVASVPPDLEAICMKCLNKDAADRYGTARELADDLGRYLANEPVSARRQPIRSAVHWVRVNRWPVIVAVVLAAAAVAYAKVRHDASERDLANANERLEKAEELGRVAQGKASAERQQREAEEKRAETERKAAHAAQVTSARERARRGDWVAALPEFDRVIQDHEPDSIHLRIERLVGYFALNDTAKLVEELDALDRAPLGEMAAQVKLIRAAWLLCDDRRQAEGRAFARAALKDRDHLFSKADGAFAEALAAERVGQAIAALRKAGELDPLHYLATSSLVVALAAVGELDEARRKAQFARGLFPFSPAPDFAEAIICVIDNDVVGLKTNLAKAAEKLPAERRKEIVNTEKYLLLVIDFQKIATRFLASENEITFLLGIAQAGLVLAKMQQTGGFPNSEPLAIPVPTVSLYYRRLAETLTAYHELGPLVKKQNGDLKMLRRMKLLTDDYADAPLLVMAATVHLTLCIDPIESGNVPEARKHLDAMADLCSRATNAPNLLPHSPVRYLARSLGAFADLGVLKFVPDAEPNLKRIRGTLQRLVADGDKWPKLRREMVELYTKLTLAPLTPAQRGAWRLHDPAGKAAFEKRRRDLLTLAQILLEDWAISEPNSAAIPRLRTDLAIGHESSGILDEND